jgi:hypothetical protein
LHSSPLHSLLPERQPGQKKVDFQQSPKQELQRLEPKVLVILAAENTSQVPMSETNSFLTLSSDNGFLSLKQTDLLPVVLPGLGDWFSAL